jgi:chitinase
VSNGVLEQWDTAGLEGVYTLQLSVIERSGNFRQVHVPVFVDNISPTIKVTYPYTDDTFIAISEGDNDKIRVQAEATDNAVMGHVDFYMDGNLLGQSSVAPFNILWPIVLTPTITASGWEMITVTHIITANAFDAAGNISTSEEILIHVAPEPPKKKTGFLWWDALLMAQDQRWIWRAEPVM